jgi:hypothetical protein
VQLGGLTYVHVMSRYQLSEGGSSARPADPWFGQPEYFTINSTGTAAGQAAPVARRRVRRPAAPEGSFLSARSWFWGDPIMQSIGRR